VDSSTFRYTIDLKDTGSTNIGTFWYAWVPGQDFLGASPTNVISPTGWNASITHAASATDGFAIRWVNSSGPLTPGGILGGFGFDSHETPAQLSGNSPFFTNTPISTSFTYIGAPLADAGFEFNVATTLHPWENPFTPLDVNNDGRINPQDVLNLINELLRNNQHSLGTPTVSASPQFFLDPNGDDAIQNKDVLAVINYLLLHPSGVAASPQTLPVASSATAIAHVPEPSALSMALLSGGLLAIAWIYKRRGSLVRSCFRSTSSLFNGL
jgi:hypothetical protein